MNGCDEVRAWLSAYLDGEVTSRRREAIEAHLAGCEACRQELASLRQVSTCLQAWQAPEARPELSARFAERLAMQTKQPEARPWFTAPWLRAVGAAGLAACLMIAVFMTRHKEAPYRPLFHSTPLHNTNAGTRPDVSAKGDNHGGSAGPTGSTAGVRSNNSGTPAPPSSGTGRPPRTIMAKDPEPAMGKDIAVEPVVDPVMTAVNALNETADVDGTAVVVDTYILAGEANEHNGAMSKAGISDETMLPIEASYENQPEALAIALITEAP